MKIKIVLFFLFLFGVLSFSQSVEADYAATPSCNAGYAVQSGQCVKTLYIDVFYSASTGYDPSVHEKIFSDSYNGSNLFGEYRSGTFGNKVTMRDAFAIAGGTYFCPAGWNSSPAIFSGDCQFGGFRTQPDSSTIGTTNCTALPDYSNPAQCTNIYDESGNVSDTTCSVDVEILADRQQCTKTQSPTSYSCPSGGTLSGTTCVTPVNGSCGSSNGQTLASAPSSNLCNAGTASAVTGSGSWNWTCAGLSGGSTASCTANKSCVPSTWSPDPVTVCSGASFTQTSNCGTTRTATGTNSGGAWSPDVSTVCSGTSFFQTNSCGTQSAIGTKAPSTWTPDPTTVCSGQSFTQTSDCGTTRASTGTNSGGAWSPDVSTVCSGTSFFQTNSCGTQSAVGTKSCAVAPTASITASPATITQGNSTTLTYSSSNATSCTASSSKGTWTGSVPTNGANTISPSATETFTFACTNGAGTTSKSVTVTVNPPACVPGAWSPATSTICSGVSFTQSNGCTTQSATGTSAGGAWSPDVSTVCSGTSFFQTNTCGTQSAIGTKVCVSTNSLTVSPAFGTTIKGIPYGIAETSSTVTYPTITSGNITLTETTQPGNTFTQWHGPGCEGKTTSTCSFLLNSDVTISTQAAPTCSCTAASARCPGDKNDSCGSAVCTDGTKTCSTPGTNITSWKEVAP